MRRDQFGVGIRAYLKEYATGKEISEVDDGVLSILKSEFGLKDEGMDSIRTNSIVSGVISCYGNDALSVALHTFGGEADIEGLLPMTCVLHFAGEENLVSDLETRLDAYYQSKGFIACSKRRLVE